MKVTLLILFASATPALGQTVDPSLWGGGARNPSGDQAVPIVAYEADTGIMFLNALSMNQRLETFSGNLIGGDDVGTIALTVPGPRAVEVLLDGYIEQDIGGIFINSAYFGGKQALFAVPAGAEYLEPSARLELFRYPLGLNAAAFGDVEMAVNFEQGRPGYTIFGGVQTVVPGDPDLNRDGLIDCEDVDGLTALIATGVFDQDYDVNEDGLINANDLELWLIEAGTREVGRPFLPGDATLDGFVDASDFAAWNASKFTFTTGWCSGNFSGDHKIDVSDFNIWSANKFRSSGTIAAVPEPDTAWWFAFGIVAMLSRKMATSSSVSRSGNSK